MCNMAIEAGAKAGLIEPDETTRAYVAGRGRRTPTYYKSDEDAAYLDTAEYDLDGMSPVVALPHLPENTKPVEECKDTRIDQVVIGSCTNGRMNDLRVAARILKGRKVAPTVRLIVIPATQAIYRQAMKEGLFEIFVDAEAAVSTPTCGPCLGGHMGILAEGERALATTNRNFVGRMGHPKSEVYLCGPAVAAASSVTGVITNPRDLAGDPE
jgi:3-isopropylmalate/(R)-2-methylmalate dehydratase large subunit